MFEWDKLQYMEKLIVNGKMFNYYEFQTEKEFEEKVIEYSKQVFGLNSIYIDVKKKLQNENIITIPDGYLLDFTFEKSPRLYIIENELSIHDAYKHIGQQLLKFDVAYKESGRKIKDFLLKEIHNNNEFNSFVNEKLKHAGYRNIDAFLEDLIFEKEVASIVVIDKNSKDLENVLSKLTMKTDIIEFQAFNNCKDFVYKFTPFQQETREIAEAKSSNVNINEIDTIVVPAREDRGFKEAFLEQDCWWQISISSSMLDKIKYIAAYETAPVSGINYYAEVASIEKYKDTNKYILYFKNKAIKLEKTIKLGKNKALAPQSPRYTSIDKVLNAKTLEDIF